MEESHIKHFRTVEELRRWLDKCSVAHGMWADAATKTAENLFTEAADGWCRLVEVRGEAYRLVNSVVIDVLCVISEMTVQILEEKQRLLKGSAPRKAQPYHTFSHKIRKGDSSAGTAIQCLKNKLKLISSPVLLKRIATQSALDAILIWKNSQSTATASASDGTAHEPNLLIEVYAYEVQEKDDDISPEERLSYPGLPTKRKHCFYIVSIPTSEYGHYVSFKRTYQGKTTLYEWGLMSKDARARYMPVTREHIFF